MIRVLPADVVASGSCISGSREWVTRNGMDFREFIKEGLPLDAVRALNCPMGNRACDAAEERAAREAD